VIVSIPLDTWAVFASAAVAGRIDALLKRAHWIRMPFGMVSGVGRWMDVLDGVGNRQRGRGSFGSEFGACRCNQWVLCCVVVRERCAVHKLLSGGLVEYLSWIRSTFR